MGELGLAWGGWGVGGSFRPVRPSVCPPGPSVRPVLPPGPSARSVWPVLPPGPSARSFRPVLPPGPSARSVRPVLPWWVGGRGPFSKSTIFNYFRHNKSEPDLKDDCIFTVFLNFIPNRFCFKPEPHELVWKSVTAILHRIVVSIFMIFFKLFKIWNQASRFFRFQTQKMCFWAWGRFGMSNNLPICLPYGKCSTNSLWCSTKVFRMNLIVNMALALFLKQLFKNWNNCKRGIGKSIFFSIELPIELPIDSAWNH